MSPGDLSAGFPHAEEEKVQCEMLALRTQVLCEHLDTLRAASNLACTLSKHSKHAEAENMQLEVFAIQIDR